MTAAATRKPAAPTERDPRQAIRVASGQLFWPFDARESEILLEDIAHALAHLCRFTGHTQSFYSVAQHAVLVSRLTPPADALYGLLHDGAEAYLGDVARPVKHLEIFRGYRDAEATLQALIYRRFGLDGPEPASVKKADGLALHVELRDLIYRSDAKHIEAAGDVPAIVAQKPLLARELFLQRFHHLVNAPAARVPDRSPHA